MHKRNRLFYNNQLYTFFFAIFRMERIYFHYIYHFGHTYTTFIIQTTTKNNDGKYLKRGMDAR